jgi:hypothetical protein
MRASLAVGQQFAPRLKMPTAGKQTGSNKVCDVDATRHLQDGIDIRTLQQWMGHRDIGSTMVYLKGVRNSDIQVRLNKGSRAVAIPGTTRLVNRS